MGIPTRDKHIPYHCSKDKEANQGVSYCMIFFCCFWLGGFLSHLLACCLFHTTDWGFVGQR